MSTIIVSEIHEFDERDESNKIIICKDGSIKPYDNIEIKIEIYEARVKKWFLDIAKEQATEKTEFGMPTGDYVSVMIALSHIEGIEKFRCGCEKTKKYGETFIESAEKIFNTGISSSIDQKTIERLYKETRCGLFHSGFPDGKIYLSYKHDLPIHTEDEIIFINPLKFIERITEDFDSYIAELKNPANEDQRTKFEFLWDKLWNQS